MMVWGHHCHEFRRADLNLLRVLDALMRERSVTRAGERIGLSQPAVSNALTRLRKILGDELFVRRGTDMLPTPRAEAIGPTLRTMLAQMEEVLSADAKFDPAAAERTFTFLGSDIISTLVMPLLSERIVEADRGHRADQREARGQRKQQWQHAIAERQPDQKNADQGIDQAEKYGVARHGREIVPAFSKASARSLRAILRMAGSSRFSPAPAMTCICAMVVPPSSWVGRNTRQSGRLSGCRPSRRDPD